MKKTLLSVLVLIVLAGGGLYLSGSDLQGRFSLATRDLTGKTTESPVLIELSEATDNDDIFMSKTIKGVPSYAEIGLASVNFTPVKEVDVLTQCEFYFGAYYNGVMYPFKSSSAPTFLSNIYISAYQGGKLTTKTNSMEFNTDGSYDVPLVFDWTLGKNTAVTLKMSGVVDQKSTLDDESFDLYMNKLTCKFNDDTGDYQWDTANSAGQNKYFKTPAGMTSSGLFLTNITVGDL